MEFIRFLWRRNNGFGCQFILQLYFLFICVTAAVSHKKVEKTSAEFSSVQFRFHVILNAQSGFPQA